MLGFIQRWLQPKPSEPVVLREPLDPVLKVLLLGTRCPESPFYALRGGLSKTVLPLIWKILQRTYENNIVVGGMFFVKIKSITQTLWPKPKDRNVNMMPFILGNEMSLPKDLRGYYPIIRAMEIPVYEQGTTCYLTIHESVVKAGTSQRRPGLHCEAPGHAFTKAPMAKSWGRRGDGWGGGWMFELRQGGIYMVSNVSNTCAGWDCAMKVPGRTYYIRKKGPDPAECGFDEIRFEDDDCDLQSIGTLGSLEHLRTTLHRQVGKPIYMQAGEVYWMTDLTPHESLPVAKDTPRQYVRVVTSQIGGWYKEHSTENPLGIVPECPIIEGNKFEEPK